MCREHGAFHVDVVGHCEIRGGIRLAVVLSEVDDLVAFGGDRHAGDDRVVVSRDEIGDDRIPVVGHPFAGEFRAHAEFIAEFALEAVHFTRIVEEVPRRIGALGAHANDGMAAGMSKSRAEYERRDGQDDFLHLGSPFAMLVSLPCCCQAART